MKAIKGESKICNAKFPEITDLKKCSRNVQ